MNILLVCHPHLIPPTKGLSARSARTNSYGASWKTEYDVSRALHKLGHTVEFCGIQESFEPLRNLAKQKKFDVAFNLLEEFAGQASFEALLVQELQDLKIPYTGCGFRPLLACRQKVTCKWLLKHQNILTPNFALVRDLRKTKSAFRKIFFPAIVKPADEDASLGIRKSSLVKNRQQAKRELSRLRQIYSGKILMERFISGREFHVTVMRSSTRVLAFRPIETVFLRAKGFADTIATENAKWNLQYRRKNKIVIRPLGISEKKLEQKLRAEARKAVMALGIDGYARLDFRMDSKGRLFVIDVNPNPDVGQGYEMAENLRVSGISYLNMIEMLLKQATERRPEKISDL